MKNWGSPQGGGESPSETIGKASRSKQYLRRVLEGWGWTRVSEIIRKQVVCVLGDRCRCSVWEGV